jgi:hypothetical protein
MNANRKIVVVTALGIVALVMTTGWSVLAGDEWPPEPYEVYWLAGQWTSPENPNTLFRIGPEDQFGAGLAESIKLGWDWGFSGSFVAALRASICAMGRSRSRWLGGQLRICLARHCRGGGRAPDADSVRPWSIAAGRWYPPRTASLRAGCPYGQA